MNPRPDTAAQATQTTQTTLSGQTPAGTAASPASDHVAAVRPYRRNHYRLLHVQPEAPLEIIRASYRTLMSRLRMHPDLGGSHEEAALLNEAYAVLCDPERRAEYDRQLRWRQRLDLMRQRVTPSPDAPRSSMAHPYSGRAICLFCGAGHAAVRQDAPSCSRCGAPLQPVRRVAFTALGGSNRRQAIRLGRQHDAIAYWGQPPRRHAVRWKDLSATGLSLWSPVSLNPGQRLHLVDPDLQTVAEVVGCERHGTLWLIRARMLTLRTARRSGLFCSTQA